MKGIIGFDHLKINCILGVYPEERTQKQPVYIDLKVQLNLENDITRQANTPTLDYVKLAQISTQSSEKQFFLLEAFANDILENIFNEFNVSWAWIKIKKPQAIKEARYAFVELEKGMKLGS